MYFREVIKRKISHEDLYFTGHFMKRQAQRPVTKEEIVGYLINREFIYEEYRPENNTHKLVYRMSGKYHLIIVAAQDENSLQIRIVTVIKSNKKIEKLISKKGFLVSRFCKEM
ncbi:MAG: hypothetical protein ACP5E4_03220 [Candidatus Aenigmatarchaeota archaeon]